MVAIYNKIKIEKHHISYFGKYCTESISNCLQLRKIQIHGIKIFDEYCLLFDKQLKKDTRNKCLLRCKECIQATKQYEEDYSYLLDEIKKIKKELNIKNKAR